MLRKLLYDYASKKFMMHGTAATALLLELTDHDEGSLMDESVNMGVQNEAEELLKEVIRYHRKKEDMWFKIMMFILK